MVKLRKRELLSPNTPHITSWGYFPKIIIVFFKIWAAVGKDDNH